MSHARVLPALLALTALACGRAPEPDDLTMGSLLGGERAGVPVDDPASLDQAATVCAAGATEFGIDVSYYQGDIDWAQVAGAGVKYAIIRVSDGTGFNDPKFDTYWSGAGANGIKRGAYQFFRPNQDAIAQADLLIAKLQAVGVGELPR